MQWIYLNGKKWTDTLYPLACDSGAPSASQNCWPGCLRQGRLTPLVGAGIGSKTTEVHQERRARPWRAPGGGLDAIIKTLYPLACGSGAPSVSQNCWPTRWISLCLRQGRLSGSHFGVLGPEPLVRQKRKKIF